MFYPPAVGYLVMLTVATILAVTTSRGQLSRNLVIGIRTKHTLRSDTAWDAAQRAGVPYLIAIAIAAGAHAIALLTVELVDLSETLGTILALTGHVVIVVIAVIAWRAADTAAQDAGEMHRR